MRYKFDVSHAGFLDSPERYKFLNPHKILKRIGIARGMKVADVGCGTGFFTLPMAERVGDEGKAFAIDIQEEMIAILNEKVRNTGIGNVETLVSTEKSIPLPDESVDLALMAVVLHELDDYTTVKEVYRILKPHGILAVLEWKKEKGKGMGPPVRERLTTEQTKEIVEGIGFKVKKVFEELPYHYLVISVKDPSYC